MNRKDQFEKSKITKASTNKVVTNVYYDAFNIEKVRFQNANYKDKTSISCFLDFEEVALLAKDAASGRLIKQLEAGQKTISIGGTEKSKNYPDGVESRILTLGKSGDTIFINMSRGHGKVTDTGAISPDGAPDLKIGVSMPVDKFRSMMIFTHDAVNAYLAHMVNTIVRECQADREAAAKQQ